MTLLRSPRKSLRPLRGPLAIQNLKFNISNSPFLPISLSHFLPFPFSPHLPFPFLLFTSYFLLLTLTFAIACAFSLSPVQSRHCGAGTLSFQVWSEYAPLLNAWHSLPKPVPTNVVGRCHWAEVIRPFRPSCKQHRSVNPWHP